MSLSSPLDTTPSSHVDGAPPASILGVNAASPLPPDEALGTEELPGESFRHDYLASQGYAPLIDVDEAEYRGERMLHSEGRMAPPSAAGDGGEEQEERRKEEEETEEERREVNFQAISARILAEMEAEYVQAQEWEGGAPHRAPRAEKAVGGEGEETGLGSPEVGKWHSGHASLDGQHPGHAGCTTTEPTAFQGSTPSSTAPALPTVPPPRPLPPLSASQEEEIKRVMSKVLLPREVTPAWAKGIDWEGAGVAECLHMLQTSLDQKEGRGEEGGFGRPRE